MTDAPHIPGFVFVDRIGEGGFADVFRYTQDLPSRQVAIKVLRSGSDPAALEQFRAEANVMAQLSNHPSIVPIYQAGVSADGRAYLVMEFCPPPHVAQRYRSAPLPVDEVLDIGVRIASAVETAHRAGILHRDIKPHNILTSSFGVPLLTDFGIASVVGESATTGQGLSVPWSPPESLEAEEHDVRSDVYALAATLWSLLQGHSPYELREGPNETPALIARIERGQVTPMRRPDVPASLIALLRRAMAADPGQRPVSAFAFGRSLQDVQIELCRSPTRLEVMDASPAAQTAEIADDPRTLIRPVSVIVPGAAPAPAGTPAPGGTGATGGAPAPGAPASTDSAPAPVVRSDAVRRGPAARIAIGTVAALVVGGLAWAVLGGTGEADERDSSVRGQEPADPVEQFDIPPAPVVTKTGAGQRWTFSWAQQQPREGDGFKVVLSGDAAAGAEPEYTTETSRTYTVAPDATLCVQVSLSREGSAPSAPSGQVCAVGR